MLINLAGIVQLADTYLPRHKRVNCQLIISTDLASSESGLQFVFGIHTDIVRIKVKTT
jgi:hypothetical protein